MSVDPRIPPDEALPESLRAELKAALVAPEEIPAEVEERILAAAARPRVAGPRRWIARSRWIAATAAAAAIVLVVAWLRPRADSGDSRVARLQGPPAYLASTEADVLDAFQLARLLRDGAPRLGEAGWDVDRDGRVDQNDVERLLDLAVRLEDR